MNREVDINEISDGKRYNANDMVKIACSDCKGCSDCCHDMGRSIILDPYDICQLSFGLNTSFDLLLSDSNPVIELSMADGLLLPNIKMQANGNCCIFLKDERCSVHSVRPGFCRLFPLGRIYEDGSFSYFHQIHECPYPNKSKIKIKKWLDIPNLAQYEHFVLKWHDCLSNVRAVLADTSDVNDISRITVEFLNTFYRINYQSTESFFVQFDEQLALFDSKFNL